MVKGKKRLARYSLSLSDDSRLRRLAEVRMPLWQWIAACVVLTAFVFFMAGLLLAFTPMRRLMPGYMEEATRNLTVENMMRLDSLQSAYEKDRAYVENILTVFDTDREPTDSASLVVNPKPMTADSVMARTPEEEKFIKMMEQREKYNISILAPLAAEGMMFNPLSDECTITEASRKKNVAEVVVASESPLSAIADGVVIDAYYSPSDGGNVLPRWEGEIFGVWWHGKFVWSRISRLGNLLVGRGDLVQAGQIVAFPQTGSGRDSSRVILEIWRNGDALVPYEVIGRN